MIFVFFFFQNTLVVLYFTQDNLVNVRNQSKKQIKIVIKKEEFKKANKDSDEKKNK